MILHIAYILQYYLYRNHHTLHFMTEQEQKERPQYEQKVQPYQEHYAAQIAAEYEEIAKMRQEDGSELPKKRIKSLQQGV